MTTETAPLPSFADLRMLALDSPMAHACISLRESQVRCAEWDIAFTPQAPSTLTTFPRAGSFAAARRTEAVKFFRHADRDYRSAPDWLGALAREVLETDSLSLFVRRTRAPGKGLLGSDVAALELIDGATIAPGSADGHLIQTTGPVHRVRAAAVGGGPLETTGLTVSSIGPRDLLYRPAWAEPGEPFGCPPLEKAITRADDGTIDLAATEAAMPEAFGFEFTAPDGFRDVGGLDRAVREHLKGVFDFVLHDLCGALDLEWQWLEGDPVIRRGRQHESASPERW